MGMLLFAIPLVLAGAPGLGAQPPAPEPIVGGEPTEDGELETVVAFESPAAELCSGTVVAPRLVLTAAHCLAGWRQSDEFRVFHGTSLSSHPATATVAFGIHPEYCESCDEDRRDYGYLELATDFAVDEELVAPVATQDDWDEAMQPGREVVLVGWGTNDVDGSGGEGVKRRVTTTIRRLSDEGLEFYAGGAQQDTCYGDSGGPAFVRMGDGSWRLAGITSRGSDPCGDGGWYGVPYGALAWLRDETGVALGDPGCPDDDCIDTAPADDGACAIGGRSSAWMVLLVLALRRRRH